MRNGDAAVRLVTRRGTITFRDGMLDDAASSSSLLNRIRAYLDSISDDDDDALLLTPTGPSVPVREMLASPRAMMTGLARVFGLDVKVDGELPDDPRIRVPEGATP